MLLQQENLWLSQKSMALLFDIDRSVVTKHIKNIFSTGELLEDSVCAIFAHTAKDGKSYKTMFYNLELVIAVGYRVNSERAIIFRNWATNILKEYIKKGSVLDTERLKQPEYILDKTILMKL